MLQLLQEFAVFWRQFSGFEQVRAVSPGFFEGSFAAPAADLVVIAAAEDFGHDKAAEFCWTGVVGVVEQPSCPVGGARRPAFIFRKRGVGLAKALIGAGC